MQDLTEHEEATELVLQILLEERFKITGSDQLSEAEEDVMIDVLSNILSISKDGNISDITLPEESENSSPGIIMELKTAIFQSTQEQYAELIYLLKTYYLDENLAPLQHYYDQYTAE